MEDLEKKVLIEFPNPIDVAGMKALLEFVGNKAGGGAQYHMAVSGHFYTADQVDKGQPLAEETVEKFSGSIRSAPVNSVHFDAIRALADPTFKGIRFFTTPGYKLHEIRKEELDLMDAVRGFVNEYFSAP